MRTKTLLMAGIALALSLATSQAQVYSANVVGYVNVTLPSAFTLATVPFTIGQSNGANEIFGGVLPDGTTILTFNPTNSKYTPVIYDTGAIGPSQPWVMGDDSTATNPPYLAAGAGFFIQAPGGASVTYVGTVAVNYLASNTNHLLSGENLVGSIIPVAGPVTNALVNLGANMPDGTTFLLFNPANSKYTPYIWDTGAIGPSQPWVMGDDSTATNPPSIAIGQAFFIQPPGGLFWAQTFTP